MCRSPKVLIARFIIEDKIQTTSCKMGGWFEKCLLTLQLCNWKARQENYCECGKKSIFMSGYIKYVLLRNQLIYRERCVSGSVAIIGRLSELKLSPLVPTKLTACVIYCRRPEARAGRRQFAADTQTRRRAQLDTHSVVYFWSLLAK